MIDLSFLDDGSYDWPEVFKYASGRASEYGREGAAPFLAVPPDDPRKDEPQPPFDIADVAEVFGKREGENDGAAWLCWGRLKDGRFFFVEAGCDYTGWG